MQKKITILLLCFFVQSFTLLAEDSPVIVLLKKQVPNASIKKLKATDHYKEAYEVKIKQPLDHENPRAGTFVQRFFLSHYDRKAPTVIVTEGYNGRYTTSEVAKMLRANQVSVEYRYMGESKPDKMDWQYLTNDQAAADLHRIRTIFKKIYRKKWVSTGISKGGSTTLIYKSKYPKDVCVAVPYVAPIALAQEDSRTDEHLKTIGSKACRDKLADFQRYALENREQLIPMIDTFSVNHDMAFSIGTGAVLEFIVLELTFSFWQYAADCDAVPERGASMQEVFDYLNKLVGYNFYSDAIADFYRPSFYQFLTELGYYGFVHDHVKDLLVSLKRPGNLIFGPQDADLSFNPAYMQNVKNFLDKKGKKILYIYGELDTWTACGYTPVPGMDALRMVKKDGSHATRISSFSEEERQIIYSKLKKWLKTEIYPLK